QVRVVAEEDDEPLARREAGKERHHVERRTGLDRLAGIARNLLDDRPRGGLARRIQHRPPHPCLERPVAAEPPPASDRVGEAVLYGLERPLAISDDRTRDAQEPREACPVEG